jgi:dienelactone hydrolase
MMRARLLMVLVPLLLLGACTATPAKKGEKAEGPQQQSRQDPQAARVEFLQMLNRPRVPLAPEVSPPTAADGVVQIRFWYTSQAGVRVPGILIKPASDAGTRRPVVIAMHGAGGNKMDQLPFLRQCVARGFIGVAIDGRYHGERAGGVAAAGGVGELNAYNLAILDAYCDTPRLRIRVFGANATPPQEPFYPLYYDTVWDVMRLVDFLRMREDVDPARIGLYGVSKGGIEAYLAGAADPRIAVVVPAIGVQTFRYGLKNNAWQGRVATVQPAFDAAARATGIDKPDWHFVEVFYNRVMPGIIDTFDGPGMLPLIAPRPLLVINSDNDKNTPIEGVRIAVQAARDAYAEATPPATDRFEFRLQPGAGHRVLPESQAAAVEWFGWWLKP